MYNRYTFQILLIICLSFWSCQQEESTDQGGFIKVEQSHSGFDFANMLDETNLKSAFNYINVYLGGGVAIGDINNDGLQDIYMTANMSSSKLYLNKGNMQFEDITVKSGTMTQGWSTAVSMADVNNDGWLDIYVNRSYHNDVNLRANLLFINNQDGTFTEMGKAMGVADQNYSVASSFFDYDLDGDLDLIVGNHPRYRTIALAQHIEYWNNPIKEFSNRLFRNDGDMFTEVTEESGVLSYGFTLGVTTSDFTFDGYPDIFITVDHDEPDLILKNNQDGTFSDISETIINQSSLSSMGIDAGDINHDPYPDLFVAEMLSEDHYREKVNMSMQSVDRFNYLTDTIGYKYYQMHNFLYLNNGNETFSDVSQLARVDKSDWSWATLFMDYNNDGWQDLYVTNGLFKDLFNRDRKAVLDSIMYSLQGKGEMAKMNQIAEQYAIDAPQTKIQNYLFHNNGNLSFSNYAEKTGLTDKTITTGAAYGDLDNDGDLDIVISNLGETSFIYENKAPKENGYLNFTFKHHPNQSHVGSKILLHYDDEVQHREYLLTRGFQSSCEQRVHFGLGDVPKVDKVEVIWPGGKMMVMENVEANQSIELDYDKADKNYSYRSSDDTYVKEVNPNTVGLDYVHHENPFNDYDIQVLLPHKLSEYGPFCSVGDVNGDKLDDLFVGSPQDQSSELFIQTSEGKFRKQNVSAFEDHSQFEDSHSAFVDIDGDNDLDLIVASTGYEYENGDSRYQPRVYTNNGNGDFVYNSNALPDHRHSSSCIKLADFDKDGDMDLFLGGRLTPHSYPLAGTSAIFENDGKGKFSNVIQEIAPELTVRGMIKDALWIDINNDDQLDLITIGEWTDIDFWVNNNGKFELSGDYLDQKLNGWWNCIRAEDLNNDGKLDLVLGNLGTNYKYRASDEKPFMVYAKDFDSSGSSDIVLGTYYGDVVYPVRGRSCSSEQIPDIGEKFESFEKYALADINEVYGEDLNDAIKYEVNDFSSIILFQNDSGFEVYRMPKLAQISPINDVVFKDLNKDGWMDIIAAGNLYQSEIETGRADSGNGLVLINQKDKSFKAIESYDSGLSLRKDTKSLNKLVVNGVEMVVVGNNNDALQLIQI